MRRRCCKPGCRNPAVATLTYVYADSQVVLADLSPLDSPHSWDLCEQHAIRLAPPMGWDLVREWVPESEREPEPAAPAEATAGVVATTPDDFDPPRFGAYLDDASLDGAPLRDAPLDGAHVNDAQLGSPQIDDGAWMSLPDGEHGGAQHAIAPARRPHLRVVTHADTE
ncbi:DUF3499 family protein [Hoyosella sp. G463]|uniref:DUF3499 family protein n=1 Tax=Lolliginicoccus lacisalsi TaxID=2742202 RepID=A0A927JCF1_9ACTN|nr:DUF3499 family protein [Lolliginicoccus lacisalsi]MBD8506605.1 DUF3499 family protein [Lolliginicoccus lacisalsi]